MAKEKKITMKDILNKLSYIFPDDAYVIGNRFVVEGEKSMKRNCAYCAVLLPEKITKVYEEANISKDSVVFYSDIKKAKTQQEYIEVYSKEKIDKKLMDNLNEKIEEFITQPLSHEVWSPFNLSGEQIDDILENTYVKYYLNDDRYIVLSKSLLPMVNKNNITDLSYYQFVSEIDDEKINTVVISFNHEMFQVYMTFKYLM